LALALSSYDVAADGCFVAAISDDKEPVLHEWLSAVLTASITKRRIVMFRHRLTVTAVILATAGVAAATAQNQNNQGSGPPCSISTSVVNNVLGQLASVVQLANGGLFTPNRMWAAVVDRQGVLCGVTRSDTDAWPGSRDIAIAKAYTANAFSSHSLALSTANLYGPTQPGGSLYGLNNSNPFNPVFNTQGTGNGATVGGMITFGGGVALYSNGQVIGGLGVSGDTSCADHAVAYRMRAQANLNVTPSNDNISYYDGSGPGDVIISSTEVNPSEFKQPHCLGAADVTP
jgi:uncharacterized protein GlcG (DUF336 family)